MRFQKTADGSWNNPPPEEKIFAQRDRFAPYIKRLIQQEKSEIWGWKDPRTSLTIELYLPYLENPFFVICHRDPLQVAESLNQRDGMDIDIGIRLTHIYEQRISNFLKRNNPSQIMHVNYEDFISTPDAFLKRLMDFLEIKSSDEQFSKAIDFVRPRGRIWRRAENIKEKELVSIIIPVLNKVEYTKRCLNTLYQVTPADIFELIVVDNGSTDGTKEFLEYFIKDHANLRVIYNRENLSFAKACNQGAKLAKGRYLLFLNNDIVPLAGWIEEMLKVIKNKDKAGIVGSKLLFPNGSIQHAGVVIYDFPCPVFPCHIYYGKPANIPEANLIKEYQAVTGACMLIPKRLFENVGGFDEGFINGYEDIDLCFRVKKSGYKII